jgi:hypothetical protein
MRLMCTIPCQAFPPLVRDSVRVQVLLGPGQTSLEASGSNPKAPGLGWELGRELRELARDLPDSWSGSLRIRDSPGIFRTSTEIQAHTHTLARRVHLKRQMTAMLRFAFKDDEAFVHMVVPKVSSSSERWPSCCVVIGFSKIQVCRPRLSHSVWRHSLNPIYAQQGTGGPRWPVVGPQTGEGSKTNILHYQYTSSNLCKAWTPDRCVINFVNVDSRST